MPRMAAARMLSLAATVAAIALLPVAPARAGLTPNEVDLAGVAQVLPQPVADVLNNPVNQILFGITSVQVRADYALVTVSDPTGLLGVLQPFVTSGVLRFAERNATLQTQAAPNDPLLNQESFLPTLAATQAWNVTNGAGVNIGIVDSGVQLGHPDLQPALASNGTNMRARNGSSADDDQGHGTEVAGAAAARGGNGVGVAGVAWGAGIIPVKVTDASGSGTATDIADGIRWAVANGAKIVNVSMAGDDKSQALEDSVNQARAAGVLLVVAAGNQGRNIDSAPAYPASFPEDNILSVGATQSDHTLAPFSNSGAGSVDIAAPGVDVITSCMLGPPSCSNIAGGGFSNVSGTSIASPLVAGMAALVASVHPDWSPAQTRSALMAAASACQPVAGVASGDLCAPADIRKGDPAATGSGGGSGSTGGGTTTGGGKTGAANSGTKTPSTATAASKAVVKLSALKAQRLSHARVRVRWRFTGDRAKVKRILVRIDSRASKRLSRKATSLVVRGKPGTHRYVVTLLGSGGSVLAKLTGHVRIRR